MTPRFISLWQVADMWAPELHIISPTQVSLTPAFTLLSLFIFRAQFNVYFTARHSNGLLSVGVASAPAILGPYKDLGASCVMRRLSLSHHHHPLFSRYGIVAWSPVRAPLCCTLGRRLPPGSEQERGRY